jgi:F0F1-type ATP synthase assembly protein I
LKDQKEDKGGNYFELVSLSMVGTQLVISTFIGFGFGYWLDTKAGTRPVLMLIFGIMGIIAGFLSVYRSIKSRMKE